jgi:hypothetical protein
VEVRELHREAGPMEGDLGSDDYNNWGLDAVVRLGAVPRRPVRRTAPTAAGSVRTTIGSTRRELVNG